MMYDGLNHVCSQMALYSERLASPLLAVGNLPGWLSHFNYSNGTQCIIRIA